MIMKKNLKYFEDELSRLSKEFTEFKKKYIGKMDFCRISLKIEYTKDREIFDKIHNLLIM